MMLPQVFISGLLLLLPEILTSHPTSATTITRPTTTGRSTTTGRFTTGRFSTTIRPTTTLKTKTVSTRPTLVSTSHTVSNSTPTTPAKPEPHTPDWDDTVTDWKNTMTSSSDPWNNYTESIPTLNPEEKMNKGFTLGTTIAALLLLLFVCALAFTGW